MKLLLQKGSDIKIKSNEGENAFGYAKIAEKVEIMMILLDKAHTECIEYLKRTNTQELSQIVNIDKELVEIWMQAAE